MSDHICMRVMHSLSSDQYIAHIILILIDFSPFLFNPFCILTYWPFAQSRRIFRIDYEIIPPFI